MLRATAAIAWAVRGTADAMPSIHGEAHDRFRVLDGIGSLAVAASGLAGLRHRGIGKTPDKGSSGEIGREHNDAVSQRHLGELGPGIDLGKAGEEMGARPDQPEHEQREQADDDAGDGRGRGTNPGSARVARLAGE